MKSLDEVRREIDSLDAELVPLLARRLRLADDVADAKRLSGVPLTDPAREEAILAALTERVEPELAEGLRSLYRALFGVSKARQLSRLSEVAAGLSRRPFSSVAIVGLGLIGGSCLKAAEVAGYRTIALHHGESEGLSDAELVLVCLPPEAIVPWIRTNACHFRSDAVVVDICGVKRPILEGVSTIPQTGWTFVGGHPMAGREVSGFANSTPDLFRGASMILTPPEGVTEEIVASLRTFFTDLGFHETVVTTAAKHDDLIAFTSQLCHVIATAYTRDVRVKDAVGFSAGSYANMTRIATQDPAVWRALYAANRDTLVPVLDSFLARLSEMREAIAVDDSRTVERCIAEGAAAKRQELLERQRGDERV